MAAMLACSTAHAAIIFTSDFEISEAEGGPAAGSLQTENFLGSFGGPRPGQDPTTNRTAKTIAPFEAKAADKIVFRASGTDDTLGGYIDNINLTAVPEPGTWALLFTGFLAIGSVLRRRRNDVISFA
ncbi:PEPxxWA-CTERM sorting domain-containing protein [Sphingobium boeckii]|uniref:Ice-binding protein C-terminal domain-containing protein n=1 Tax=Sphingobium boeckii TaxID=1082345 RepID=A0A7W9AJ67_9SPHN|nr:PEPxxWA-CTERM sorting domain-containing protein [Sphingobium boeckii]MBB5686620.1 hypothetical protein [Sphingobium boeckii]